MSRQHRYTLARAQRAGLPDVAIRRAAAFAAFRGGPDEEVARAIVETAGDQEWPILLRELRESRVARASPEEVGDALVRAVLHLRASRPRTTTESLLLGAHRLVRALENLEAQGAAKDKEDEEA